MNNHKRNIRMDLIEKELKRMEELIDSKFQMFKPSKTWLKKVFKEYNVEESSESFYDTDPEFDEELFNMYMDYNYQHKMIDPRGAGFYDAIVNMDKIREEQENFRFSKGKHTEEELKNAYYTVLKEREKYDEKRRIEMNNWIEPYFVGNWGLTKRRVNHYSKKFFKNALNHSGSLRDRFWKAEANDRIFVYFYGRDVLEVDYFWIFAKKGTKKKRNIQEEMRECDYEEDDAFDE